MSQSDIRALVPGGLARTAALSSELPPTVTTSALIRAAVVMFASGDKKKAIASMQRTSNTQIVGDLDRDTNYLLSAHLGEHISAIVDVHNKSQAIRTGLAMLCGWTKEDAESQRFVAPQGRPKKVTVDA